MQPDDPRPRPHRDAVVALRDGRRLAYAEFGVGDGKVVLWFHGTPGARTQIPPDIPELARRHGLRVIAIDRPGTGGSSPEPRRTLLSWADDVAEFADALGIDRFAAVGLSGGGPYVLACAHRLPERVVVGVSLGGVGPTAGPERAPGIPALLSGAGRALTIARNPLARAMSAAVRPFRPLLSPAFDFYARYGARVDREVLEQPAMRAMFTADLEVVMAGGVRGIMQDLALFTRPWAFSLRDIHVPIRLWHGTADPVIPLAHSEHLAALVPDSRLFLLPGLGHFAGFTNSPAVLDDMMEIWSRGDENDHEK